MTFYTMRDKGASIKKIMEFSKPDEAKGQQPFGLAEDGRDDV
jgi:hypothetical protein